MRQPDRDPRKSGDIVYLGYAPSDREAPHQGMAALQLAHRGLSVHFMAWSRNTSAPPEYKNIRFDIIARNGLFSFLKTVTRIARALRTSRSGILYVQGAPQTPIAAIACLFVHPQAMIYHTQDILPEGGSRLYAFFERRLARQANAVILNEPNRAVHFARHYGLASTPHVLPTYLPSWWPPAAAQSSRRRELLHKAGLRDTGDCRIVVAGGPFDPGRMSHSLVQAFQTLPPNYMLVFTNMEETGDAARSFRQYTQDHAWSTQRIILLPALSFGELMNVFAAGDIGMLLYPHGSTGHYFQAPGRLTEYLRNGVAVVASDFPGLAKLIRDNDLGATAEASDPNALAMAIRALGDVDEQCLSHRKERLSEQAHRRFVYETAADPLFDSLPDIGLVLRNADMRAKQSGA